MLEQQGQSPFPSLNGSMVADSGASRSKYSLPTVSSFTATATSVDTVRPCGTEESMGGNVTQGGHPMRAVIVESVEDDVPLAVLSRKLQTKGFKKVDALKLSREGCPNPILPSNEDEGTWIFTEETMQRLPWVKVSATGAEDP